MTIDKAIADVDEMKPNQVRREKKIEWLAEVDAMIWRELIKTHDPGREIAYSGYNGETDGATVLFAVAPYDRMYVHYLAAQIDLWNQEFDRYQNNSALFNQVYSEYSRYYNRLIRPLMPENMHY